MKTQLVFLFIISFVLVNCDRILSPDSDGSSIYNVLYNSNNKIYIMDQDGSDRTCITEFIDPDQSESVSFADFHHQEKKILFEYVNYEHQTEIKTGIMNLDGTDHQLFNNAKYRPNRPVFSSDGSLVLFSAGGDSSGLYQMDVDGSNILRLSAIGESVSFIKKVAGTNDIIYVKKSNNKYDIYRRNLDSNVETPLTQTGDLYHYDFGISANGKLIAYSSSNRLYLMNSDGTEKKQILNKKIVAPPAIKNNKIAYVIMTGNGFEIRITDLDGESNQTIATTEYPSNNDYWRPNMSFSPDGKKLFFTGCQENNFDIYRVDLKDENLVNISGSDDNAYLGGLYSE